MKRIKNQESRIRNQESGIKNQESRIKRTGGFTLLEVLIAIMIFVLAIAAILPLFAVGTTSHMRGVDESHLAWIAPRIAAKLQENLFDSRPKDVRDGKWTEAGLTYTYDATFKPMPALGRDDPLAQTSFLLRVEVRHGDLATPRVEVFETVVLRRLLR